MEKIKSEILYLFLAVIFTAGILSAQSNTVGLVYNDSTASYDGYTLFAPITSTKTYLIDNKGYLVHSWNSSYKPGQAVMLLEDGSLLRTASLNNPDFNSGGTGGRIEKYDWDGNLTWSFDYSSSTYCTHHDVESLPNGNILLISWENKSYDDAVAAGKNPSLLGSDTWSEKIIEVKPNGSTGGDIVWEWHAWDHLVQDFDASKNNYGSVAAHPELINLNFGPSMEDWLHINSVRYDSAKDQILVSVHNFSEIWIIDHSTTTAEAASHTGGNSGKGGDILFRWGNPRAYDEGTTSDQKLFGQHDARWIEQGLPGAGDILIFNNGQGRTGGNYSTVDEITPPSPVNGNYITESSGRYGPDSLTWQYRAENPSSFYAQNISGADRLPNGNTLICQGTAGRFFEADSAGNVVWEYINPVTADGILSQGEIPTKNIIFKIYRYSKDYPGLSGKDLTEKGTIESYPTGVENSSSLPAGYNLGQNYPNPFNPATNINYDLPRAGFVSIKLYDSIGREVETLVSENQSAGSHNIRFNSAGLSGGVYFYRMVSAEFQSTRKMIVLK